MHIIFNIHLEYIYCHLFISNSIFSFSLYHITFSVDSQLMTSETNFTIPKFDEEDFYPNGTLPNRLLSPITEHSADTQQTYSDTSKNSSESVLSKNKSTIDELNEILLPKCHQYITYFYHIQTYLNTLQKHFEALSIIVNNLRKDRCINHVIEPIEIRMLQMHAKRNQIDNLLNKSSIKMLLQQVCLPTNEKPF